MHSKRQFKVRYQTSLAHDAGAETYAVAIFSLSNLDGISEKLGDTAAQLVVRSLGTYIDTVFGSRIASGFSEFWQLTLAFVSSLVVEGGRWLGYRYLFPRGALRLSWRNGVMYSLGYASVETMLLIAGLTFIWFLGYAILSQVGMDGLLRALGSEANPSLRDALQAIVDTSWQQPIVVAVERMLDLPHQIAWSLLVMQSLIRGQKRWFGFSVLYHTSVAVIVPGLARLAGFWVAEGINLVLASLSLWIVLRIRVLCLQD